MKKATKDFFNKISDYDIFLQFEEYLNEQSTMMGIGYFTGEAERDEKGVKIVLRVAAMIDTAGEEDFIKKEDLKRITIEYPDHNMSVTFVVEEAVSVSGMEIEVIYRPE